MLNWFNSDQELPMIKYMKSMRRNVEGATAIEYGLIAALIAIAIITSFTSLAETFVDEPMQDVIDGVNSLSS